MSQYFMSIPPYCLSQNTTTIILPGWATLCYFNLEPDCTRAPAPYFKHTNPPHLSKNCHTMLNTTRKTHTLILSTKITSNISQLRAGLKTKKSQADAAPPQDGGGFASMRIIWVRFGFC